MPTFANALTVRSGLKSTHPSSRDSREDRPLIAGASAVMAAGSRWLLLPAEEVDDTNHDVAALANVKAVYLL